MKGKWVEGADAMVTWRENVTGSSDLDLKTGETYRGIQYRRFENIGNETYDDVTYHPDKNISHTICERPDKNGIITNAEALDWYHFGNGQDLYVDVANMDFKSTALSVEDFTRRATTYLGVNFFRRYNFHYFLDHRILWRPAKNKDFSDVFGTLGINLVDPSTGEIRLSTKKPSGAIDRYDFRPIGRYITSFRRSHGNPQAYNLMPLNGTSGFIHLKSPEKSKSVIRFFLSKSKDGS